MPANPKPTKVYAWASGDDADVVEPTTGEITTGWVSGQTPPAPYMNALMGGDYGTAPWLQYVQTFTEVEHADWARQTFPHGFAASGVRSTVVGLDVTGGQTVGGGLATDTLTASGAVTGASLSAGAGTLTGGAATLASASISGIATIGTVKTATLSPATTDGTIATAGSHTLTGTGATLTAPIVAATTGNFSGTVTAASFSGSQAIEARHVVSGGSLLNGWTSTGAGVWYYKDNANRLWLYVAAAGGNVGLATPVFNLPAGWRPTIAGQELNTDRLVAGQNGILKLYVAANGDVSVYGTGFTNGATIIASAGAGSPGFIATGSIWLGA